MKRLIIFIAVIALATPLFSDSPSWPCWRGPNHDGVSTETGWNPEALKGGAKVVWKANIGPGYSNIAVSGGRVYTFGKDPAKLQAVISCWDAADGTIIWKNTDIRHLSEVESTPCVDGELLYFLTFSGTLVCMKTSDGTVTWTKNMWEDFGEHGHQYGWASSPVTEGDQLLLNTSGHGLALNKRTGELSWKSEPVAGDSYPSPVVFGSPSSRIVLMLGPATLSAVEPGSGKVLWSFRHAGPEWVLADPIALPDGCIYSFTTGALKVALKERKASVAWTAHRLGGLSPAVFVNGYLFGSDCPENYISWLDAFASGKWDNPTPLVCVDPATGSIIWSAPPLNAAVSAAGDKLIILESTGILHIADASPAGYHEYSQADVLEGAKKPRIFATPPVLCDGRIYCRNYAGDLICIDVSK